MKYITLSLTGIVVWLLAMIVTTPKNPDITTDYDAVVIEAFHFSNGMSSYKVRCDVPKDSEYSRFFTFHTRQRFQVGDQLTLTKINQASREQIQIAPSPVPRGPSIAPGQSRPQVLRT